eukprot:Skav236836  [mRNA]  locus=scaffold1027:59400:64313:+ [translate_table: standard]
MQFLFADGSCLHPKEKRLRLAASSVIQGHSNATHTVRWAGPLPTSCQSSYRAEVYALGVAVRLVCRAFLCCDCEAAVKVARRLLALPPDSREAALPSDHRDLWLYFIHGAAHIHPGAVHVRWVRAHRSWKMLTGRDRVLAWFNEVADREAQSALALRVTPAYTSLVDKWLQLKQWAVALADFHIAVAKDFVSVRAVEKSLPPAVDFEPHGSSTRRLANNQWDIGAELGSDPMTSAFARVLTRGPKEVAMVLDKERVKGMGSLMVKFLLLQRPLNA